jgi:fumarylacetoacetate (FAA) hydrolase
MKLASFTVYPDDPGVHLGVVSGERIIQVGAAREWAQAGGRLGPALKELAADSLLLLLEAGPEALADLRDLIAAAEAAGQGASSPAGEPVSRPLASVRLLAPLPVPRSLRDFYAFEQHVKTARANRGLEMIPEWYELAVFYFSNHQAVIGPDAPITRPKASRALDYELEIGCVIGRGGRDIPVEQAGAHIAGYCVMNDWSARDLQMKEMKMSLGPAKGKDFATTLGPWLTTPDELAGRRQARATGAVYDLAMVARVNGEERSRGNWRDIHFTFEQMIARASADVTLYPGDVLGSGTVGTGCLLELTRGQGPYLEPGDVVELEIEGLGVIRNTVVDGG